MIFTFDTNYRYIVIYLNLKMRLCLTIYFQSSVSFKLSNLEYHYILFFPWLVCILFSQMEVSVVTIVFHGTSMIVANNSHPMCPISIIESINNMVGHSRIISSCTLFKTFFRNCYCKIKMLLIHIHLNDRYFFLIEFQTITIFYVPFSIFTRHCQRDEECLKI